MSVTPLRPFGRKVSPASLPSPTSTYEPFLKRELAHRLFLICSVFVGFTWLFSFISTLDFTKGPPLGVLGHLTATSLTALFALVIGAVPPLVLRGHAVSEKYTPLATRAEMFVALVSSARTWRTLACFAGSGFSLALLHVGYLNLSEWEDSRLSILSPTRRNAFRLNERFFYLAFFNASFGLVFASRDLIRQRWIVKWPRYDDQSDSITPANPVGLGSVLAVLKMRAITSTIFITLIHVLLFPVWYHLLRVMALPILRHLPWLSGMTRPLLHAFGRTWTVDIPWSRLLALGFKTSLGWELVESAFDDWPISVSQKASNPNQVLVAGLHSQDRYFKHHAYFELCLLARSQSTTASARRTALFTDTNTSPTLWNSVVRELLITLGRDYQCLLRRGKPPLPVPPAPAPPATPRTPKTPSTPLIRKEILKPSPRSLFDSLASDEAMPPASTSSATRPESLSVPSVFLPSTPPASSVRRSLKEDVNAVEVKKAVVKNAVSKTTSLSRAAIVSGLLEWAGRKLPQEWRLKEWWTDVSIERHAKACIPDGVLDAVGIDALSHLVTASLKDDTLGSVQRDIPRTLEALLSFLFEAEAFQAELESKLPPAVGQDAGASRLEDIEATRDVARAIEVVLPVLHALRGGVSLITKTFGDHLSVFKFPPVTAKRLQSFMDGL
ncbi:nucleoporin protein Ndc1-Nup [Gautieria morchelliformis]|nr:nucleoporin protein Ndc1-Nup [Gautieria morchelliformis]